MSGGKYQKETSTCYLLLKKKIEISPDGAMLVEVLISPAVTEPAEEEGGS